MDGYVTTPAAAAAPLPPLVWSLHVTASNMLGFLFNFIFIFIEWFQVRIP
jgi:hypothetical protein